MYRYYINCDKWNPTSEQWIYATRCITKTELERIDKFVFQRDAKFALAGQLLIRYLLSKAFQLCIAGTFNGQIGCDTMEYQVNKISREPIESTTKLLQREFSKNEYDFILNKSQDEKKRFHYFYRIWCLKESYVKYLGIGIGFTLSRLNFCIKTDEFDENNSNQILSNTLLELDNKLTDDEIRFDEQIIYLSNNEQQIITVCLPKTDDCQPFIELTIEDILKDCTSLDENQQDEEKWWNNFQRKK